MPPDTSTTEDAKREREHDGWQTLRRFLPYLWPRDNPALKRRIVIAMALVLAAKGVTLALPFAYRDAVDAMSGETSDSTTQAVTVAMALVLAYGLGRFTSVAFDQMRNMVFERVGQVATLNLAKDVFHRLHRLSLRFHLSRRTGEVTKVIERGTKSIDMMITYIAVTRWITEWRTKLRREMNDLDGKALHRAVDSLLNYETVKYFGAERREEARYGAAAQSYSEAAIKSENSLGLLNITQALITNGLMAGAMAFSVWGWSQGKLTVGDLVFVNTYLLQLFRPLDLLGWVYRTIRQGLVDMGEMFKLMDTPLEVTDAPGAPALIVRKPHVAFENVTFGYEPDRTILRDLSFEVPAGSNVAIVGPSGAGKSTIGRLLFRFYDPQSGRVLIDGQDLAQVQQDSVRSAIGIVPQDSVLFNDTIGYNIGYGAGDTDQTVIEQAAHDASIWPFIEQLPHGLNTEVGERGLKLSGGEKQRVAIARTLVKNPPILLLDEATSALDSRTEQDILRTLRRISAGRTTIAIAHRLSTIADADQILVLDAGSLAEQGTHDALLVRDGLYAEMWARQLAERDDNREIAE